MRTQEVSNAAFTPGKAKILPGTVTEPKTVIVPVKTIKIEVVAQCPACELATNPHKKDRPDWRYIDVTPAMAKHWIECHNTSNRKIRDSLVQELIHDIAAGKFASHNGTTLSIDINGNVLNGQHRLIAVSRGEKTVTLMCALGVVPDDRDTIDIGRSRSGGDIAGMHGYIYPGTQMAIAKLMILERDRQLISWKGNLKSISWSIRARHEFLSVHAEEILEATRMGNRFHTFGMGQAMTGFLYSVGAKQDELMMLRFLWMVRKCVPASQWDSPSIETQPAYLLHFILAHNKEAKAKRGGDDLLRFAVKAWLLTRQGRELRTLKLMESDKLQKMVDAAKEIPTPTYNDIDRRALDEIRLKIAELKEYVRSCDATMQNQKLEPLVDEE